MSRRDDLQLDKRFDDLVFQLRPYALRLKSSEDSWLCRLWLERLNRAEEQRNLRNDYLFELYKQLKKGFLRPPFHKPPETNAKLMPLSKLQRLCNQPISSSCNDFTETSPPVSPTKSPQQPQQLQKCSWPRQRSKSLARRDNAGNSRRPRSLIPKRCDSSSPSRITRDFLSPVAACDRDNRNLLRTYKERIETLSTIVEELEAQNEKLKQKLASYQNKESYATPDEVAQMHARIKQLTSEIDALKNELSKVNDIKEKLKAKHDEIVERYKAQMSERVNSMKQQLEGTQSENAELKEKIASVEKRLEELSRENESAKSARDKMEGMRARYEKSLREKEEEIGRKNEQLKIKTDECEQLMAKMSELQQQLESKTQEEGKLQSMLADQYNAIKDELAKMRGNLESASFKQNENYHQEISILMKNVEKLRKFTRKLKEEYNRKIYHVKKENEKIINDLQMRLKAKCNGAGPFLLVDSRYCDTDTESPIAFERDYKKFLDSLAKSADSQRSKYYEKLSFLDNQLDQFGCHLHRNNLPR